VWLNVVFHHPVALSRVVYIYTVFLCNTFLLDLFLCLFTSTTCFGLHTRPSSGGYYSSRSLLHLSLTYMQVALSFYNKIILSSIKFMNFVKIQ
jgi:hypothetical protein